MLTIVLEQCKRLSGLVNNILSFSRRQEIRGGSVRINGVLEDLLSFLQDVKGKRVTIHTDFASDLPCLRGDANQIQQVFMNLILNAFDAMEDGGILRIGTSLTDMTSVLERIGSHPYTLAFEPAERSVEERVICVEISDEGTGISERHLARIFEPFFTTKEEGAGTGLGLAICRSIVEKYGGNILIASSGDGGSTASVLLPVGCSGKGEGTVC